MENSLRERWRTSSVVFLCLQLLLLSSGYQDTGNLCCFPPLWQGFHPLKTTNTVQSTDSVFLQCNALIQWGLNIHI